MSDKPQNNSPDNQPQDAEDSSRILSQNDIEALMDDISLGAPGVESTNPDDMDAVLPGGGTPAEEAAANPESEETPLDDTTMDDVLGVEDPEADLAPPANESGTEKDVHAPDLADLAAADIGAENAAAGAAPDEREIVDQNLIDSLIADAQIQAPSVEKPPVEEIVITDDTVEMALGDEDWGADANLGNPPSADARDAAPKKKASSNPNAGNSFARVETPLAKIAVSLLFGIVCGLATFSWLVLNQARLSGGRANAEGETIIQRAVASAEGLVEDGLYERAALELDDALAAAPHASNRSDAEYWKIKADYRALSEHPDARDAESILTAMGRFVELAPEHPRVTEVLRWRGDVYDRTGIPLAALNVYNDLLTNYVSPLDGDRILLAAGKTALDLDRPQQAADYLKRLRQEYPASPVAEEAALYQGDAYAKLGAQDKAKLVYQQIAVANPAERVGGQAYARLAQLSYDEGEYDDAIALLETRLATATTTDGNEEAYLLLARSLRATGQYDEAERVLRELTQFFPENNRTAEAMVELSQVMDARGRRSEAANIARQAAQRYPQSTAALENAALFLAQAGDERGAAESLLEADAAGANKPELLLNAARHYAETGEIRQAQYTYEQLLDEYGNTPEAFEGRIELAGIYFDQGKVQKSIDWLEDLAEVHAQSPRAVPVLLALGKQYSELGLRGRAAAAQKKVAAVAGEQTVLAEAAIALLEGGDTESGLAAAEQIDVERLPNEQAYRFLRAHGLALRKLDGRRALAQLERAYFDYPNQRKPEHTLPLLKSYLAADRTGAARALVMDLDTMAKSDIAAVPALTKAAVAWGDHLFDRRDFRAAAEAYKIAENAVTEEGDPLVTWAKLQRANAMLQMRDASSSAPLLTEVAESNAPWSDDADVREAYAEIERRLAHEDKPTSNGD